MRRISFCTLILFITSLTTYAQQASFKPHSASGTGSKWLHPDTRIHFYYISPFFQVASRPLLPLAGDNEISDHENGKAFGVDDRIGYIYNEGDRFQLGWFCGTRLGYGKYSTGKHWFPFVVDLAFNGSYLINDDNELGFTYSFLGIYGYSTQAYFGSQVSLIYRYSHFQAEIGRDANGALIGCFNPKSPISSRYFDFKYLLNGRWHAGFRLNSIKEFTLNEKNYHTKEWMFSVGYYFMDQTRD